MNLLQKQNFIPSNPHSNYSYPLILLFFLLTLITFLKSYTNLFLLLIILISSFLFIWSLETSIENNYLSNNPYIFHFPFKTRILIFILSEILLFITFFWSIFHFKLIPDTPTGLSWSNLLPHLYFNPTEIPLLNTIILLSSGVTLTISHFKFFFNKYSSTSLFLFLTLILGLTFSSLQIFEYKSSPFSLNDNIYSNIFFFITGFHGLHVQVGTILLYFNFLLTINILHNYFNITSFELASWYWHFVDIIWLFLFTLLYH